VLPFYHLSGNIPLMTLAVLNRAKSVTPLTIVALQHFLNRLVVDSPHLGRVEHFQDDSGDTLKGRGNGKRPMNKVVEMATKMDAKKLVRTNRRRVLRTS
jgi:hypothetical protein